MSLDCDFEVLRSADDGPAFFACMGHFFASPSVRREGYVCPQARGRGLFRELCRRVLAHIDAQRAESRSCVRADGLPCFLSLGFEPRSRRGNWITIARTARE